MCHSGNDEGPCPACDAGECPVGDCELENKNSLLNSPIKNMRKVRIKEGCGSSHREMFMVATDEELELPVLLAQRVSDLHDQNPILALYKIEEIVIFGPRIESGHNGYPYLEIIFNRVVCTWYPKE